MSLSILALETSTDWPSLALLTPERLLGERLWEARQTLAERLVPKMQELLKEANLSPQDLSLIAVSRGPGSFTGIRIGVVTAKGLAQALGIPLLGVSALDALAWGTPCQGFRTCVALLPAPKRGVYVGVYQVEGKELHRQGPFRFLLPHQVVETLTLCPLPGLLTGTASAVERWLEELGQGWQWAGPAFGWPRASVVGALAWQRWQRGEREDLHSFAPLYLKPTEAEEKLGTIVYPPRP